MSEGDISDSIECDERYDFELSHPPPNKKYRVTPLSEYTESDVTIPTILGTLLPVPPPPKPETKESIQQLLAPYKSKSIQLHAQNTRIYHPRISVIKHKNHMCTNMNHKHTSSPTIHSNPSKSPSFTAISRVISECSSTLHSYITVYDVPDSCWSLIFQFCSVEDLIFHIASINKFFQSLVVDQSTWIHRRVIMPSKIYKTSLKKKTENTLESMFLNWTSLKQLDIMIAPETNPERVTYIWRMLCAPRPKIHTLRIGNSISLPGGDLCAVNETAFKYLKLIQDIEVLDFSFNMFSISYEAIVDFFAAQAGQIYTAPPKPKRNFLSQWNARKKEKNEKVQERNSISQNDTNIDSKSDDIKPIECKPCDVNTNNSNTAIEHQSEGNEAQPTEKDKTPSVDTESHVLPVLDHVLLDTEIDKDTQSNRQKPNKIKKISPDEEEIDTQTNVNNTNATPTHPVYVSHSVDAYRSRKRSVLGKRRRYASHSSFSQQHIMSKNCKKKRKRTRSQKREMDSEDESHDTRHLKINDDEDNNDDDEDDDDLFHTYPQYKRRRKRRRISESCVLRRALKEEFDPSPIKKANVNNEVAHDSKQEQTASPPTKSRKKIYIKRSPHYNNHKRHRAMRRKPSRYSLSSMRPFKNRKKSNYRIGRIETHPYHSAHDRAEISTCSKCEHDTNNNYNRNTPKIIKKEVIVPKEFKNILSCTPSPITSPIVDDEAFRSSVYGKKVRKTILSNIDKELMSTLRLLNNDELELNLSLTLNIDSIDIGLNDNDNDNNQSFENDNDKYYESYRENLSSDYLHIDRKKDSMKDLGRKSKLRRIYFRDVCMKSFPDLAYNYLNTKRIESLSLYTGDTSSLIAFIDKCGSYPIIKKIEIDGTSPFRWRCAPLCEALTKCINLCSIQLPSIVDAVDIIAFDSFINAAVNLTEIGLVTGDRQLFKPIHDVINKHGFKMDINPSGLRFIFARRKNKPELRQQYIENKKQFLERRRSKSH